MTLSTNNPVYAKRKSATTLLSRKRRSAFDPKATNVRIVASSGMILCSAILINLGLEATGSETPAPPCDLTTTKDNHCQTTTEQRIDVSPEATAKPQWSDRFTDQLKINKSPETLPKEVETTYSELLNRAQAAASRDQLTTAVETVSGIPKNSQYFEMAQQLEEDWSKELVRQATNHFQQAEVTTSIALIDKIPESSEWHDRGTELKQQWKKQAALLNQAKSAKSAEDWQGTINAIKAMEGTPLYNSLPVQELLQQAMINRYEPDPALLQIAVEDAPMLPQADSNQVAAISN
ncbi:hypothetical protein IQ250_01840 [Pseudanabaenaceae cyanobacterium LEGE 13415]|nr:hypothetical protein [Pseudanabaenaceae cyanobacterium LEGE 13415]